MRPTPHTPVLSDGLRASGLRPVMAAREPTAARRRVNAAVACTAGRSDPGRLRETNTPSSTDSTSARPLKSAGSFDN